ncbi:TolC family protein [Bacteroides sp. 224]|uniref:TolC family protein n=1 Tax=Bacteroides sp. 224 TaxID=2302936 RepID=UPI0013D56C45|nr:TolC family protein [Bacteroides sp. 224]NDV65178.1 hypothetical protein [Bacteroides sp. 224]
MVKFYKKSHLVGVFLLLLCTGNPFSLNAQNIANINHLDIEEYANLSLPPLDVLFENAKTAPSYELAQIQEEFERRILKKEKRAFLGFFSIRGSWQYGNFSNDGSFSDIMNPIMYTYNKVEQTSYSVGAGVSIPLDALFDLGPRVKRQKLKVRTSELQKEIQYQDLKQQILELYLTASSQLTIVKLRSEALALANIQYAIVEKNFMSGIVDSNTLSQEKEKQSMTMERYENSRSQLTKSIMMLEIITNTPIIKK